MNEELIAPAAVIAAEVLRQTQPIYGEITEEVIASAFAQAYRGLLAGVKEAKKSHPPVSGAIVQLG
ncbi:hypothetical protein [Delftia sp. PS-11]|uniref:hypothetical protein n=1 Tax=Delftia sp. PS-11 TaxID=2767222 RepID=UPI002454EF92|nr:hypothetical protein [Delftia sp. PS-11]KAJ8743664.1 hypothetical protein H9T68_15820 [Delftia sp. PS-11]